MYSEDLRADSLSPANESYQNQVDNGSQSDDSDSQNNYELVPQEAELWKPRTDQPLQYHSKPFVKQDQQDDHHSLLPRENESRQLRADVPASFGSRPFVHFFVQQHTKILIEQTQRSNNLPQRKNTQSSRQDHRQLINQQIPVEFTHQMQKNLPLPDTEKADQESQKWQRHQTQKQSCSSSLSSESIVSKSSERQQAQQKQADFKKQQWTKVHHPEEIDTKNHLSRIVKKQQELQKIFVQVQQSHLNPQKPSNEQSFNSEFASFHKTISIEGQQLGKAAQNIQKYHFQTEKYTTNGQKQKITYSRENQYEEENLEASLKLIKISPEGKGEPNEELEISFSPLERETKQSSDPYDKYKRSAQTSPILQLSHPDVSIQKHAGYERYLHGKQNLEIKQSPNSQQKKGLYIQHTPFKAFFLQEDETSQQKLAKSQQQIDSLRKNLLKSTQNNINAIFNTNLTSQECYLTQMVEGIQKKIGNLYEKMDRMEGQRVKQIEWEIEKMRLREREMEMEREERLRERELERQRQMERRQEMDERYHRNGGPPGNVILDLGRNVENQGKIIAIYPANKISNVKQLILSHKQNSHKADSQNSNLKVMLQLQQNFMKTLQQFQQQVNSSIDRRLCEIKSMQQQKDRSHYEIQQKFERVSQETNDRDEEFDDSRGSINVIYLRRLRELEEMVKEKQWSVDRLEKHNYQLQKQLEKWEQLRGEFQGQERKLTTITGKIHPEEQFPLTGLLSFKKNPALNPSFKHSSALLFQQEQSAAFSFSKPPLSPLNNCHSKSVSSSSQKQQQRIKQPASLTTDELNFLNPHSKKKYTHSFHFSESKNIQANELVELKERLSQYELAMKEKDLRIRELENTIMDQLESSRKWKLESSSSKSSKISGYESVISGENESEVLQIKINNLKTLLKETKKQAEKYEKLYNEQKYLNSINMNFPPSIKTQVKLAEDMVSNTSKSVCVSEKTTVKHERIPKKIENGLNSPFVSIMEQDSTIQKGRILSQEHEGSAITEANEKQQQVMLTVLVNFIMMAWSLKDVVRKLCGKDVNVEKIDRNARQFLQQLKSKGRRDFMKLQKKLQECSLMQMMRGIWVD